jgi:hypothetical protein
MPSNNGNEYELAIASKKVKESSDEEIKQVLRFAMILVGIKAATISAMAEEEKQILIQFFKTQFGWFSLDEIKIAFTKACACELDVDARPFENFTCEYIGRIMKAYKEWATEEKIKLRSKESLEKYRKLDLITYEDDGLGLADMYYTEFLEGNFNFKTATSLCWDKMKALFKIIFPYEKNMQIIREAKILVISEQDQVLQTYNSKNYFHSLAQHCKNEIDRTEEKDLLKFQDILNYCKRIGLLEWFKEVQIKGYKSITEYKENFKNENI